MGHVQRSARELGKLCRIEAFPIPQEHSRLRMIADHLHSGLAGRVYTIDAYESATFRGRLRALLRDEHFDLVHVDSLDLSTYLPEVRGIPTVCTHHNVESALLDRRSAQETGVLRRGYIRLQARRTRSEEARWAPRIDLNVTVSRHDADTLAAIAPAATIMVVPNGVDTAAFRPQQGVTDGIVFVGGRTWFPNRDAMEYFAHAILPRIRRSVHAPVRVTWVGRAGSEVGSRYQEDHGIELTGYVESIQPYVARAACYVVPLRVGGGTRLKILDAWAMGKAVVSTSVGCEGLDARDGQNILVRDEPEEFAEAVVAVLSDPDLRNSLGRAARRTAEQQYDWDVIASSMIPAYESLLGR